MKIILYIDFRFKPTLSHVAGKSSSAVHKLSNIWLWPFLSSLDSLPPHVPQSRRQRRPKSALKTTPIVPTVSSLTAAGLSASNSPKRIPLMPSASASGSKSYNSVTYSYATLETALNDRASSIEGGGVPTMLDPTSSMAPMGTSTSIPMTTTTTKANLGPAILDSAYDAAATSFSRQAIRSTYMDKSIEAKKKVSVVSLKTVLQDFTSSLQTP